MDIAICSYTLVRMYNMQLINPFAGAVKIHLDIATASYIVKRVLVV